MLSPLVVSGEIFGLGVGEMLIILAVVLVLFGPKSLPALGRSLGKGLREFKDASGKFTEALDDAAKDDPADRSAASRRELPAPVDARPLAKSPASAVVTSSRAEDDRP